MAIALLLGRVRDARGVELKVMMQFGFDRGGRRVNRGISPTVREGSAFYAAKPMSSP